jgi:hypothetical protein
MLPAMGGPAGGPVTRRALLTGGAAGLVGVALAAVAVRQGVLTGDDERRRHADTRSLLGAPRLADTTLLRRGSGKEQGIGS